MPDINKKIIAGLTVLMFWLLQAFFEYLFFIFLIFSSREIAAWFGDSGNLNCFLLMSAVLAAFLLVAAVWFAKRFYRRK